MSEDAAVDGRLGHHVATRGVIPFLRKHLLDLGAVVTDDDLGASGDVVWPGHVCHAIKPERVTAGSHNVARRHAHVLFGLITSDERDADDEHCDAEMGPLHSVVTATLRAQLLERAELA